MQVTLFHGEHARACFLVWLGCWCCLLTFAVPLPTVLILTYQYECRKRITTMCYVSCLQAAGNADQLDVNAVLKAYQNERMMRASTIHGMAGMAAIMASTYKAYFGEGLGPLSWIQKYQIPHPGRVAGRIAMTLTMPAVLQWVLGGNTDKIEKARVGSCRIEDKPKVMTVRLMWS